MPSVEEPALTPPEWIVLAVICEGRTHGREVTRLLAPYGEVGHVWNVQKATIYRSINRLTDFGLIRSAGEEPSHRGPVRFMVEATDAGQAAAASWLRRPVQHTRDIRSELLIKLALLDRSGADPHDLLVAQRALLVPIMDGLQDRLATATGFDRTLLVWRYETASGTIRFLDAMASRPSEPAGPA
jgi:DNA-binding PadR family transcriptional regulator